MDLFSMLQPTFDIDSDPVAQRVVLSVKHEHELAKDKTSLADRFLSRFYHNPLITRVRNGEKNAIQNALSQQKKKNGWRSIFSKKEFDSQLDALEVLIGPQESQGIFSTIAESYGTIATYAINAMQAVLEGTKPFGYQEKQNLGLLASTDTTYLEISPEQRARFIEKIALEILEPAQYKPQMLTQRIFDIRRADQREREPSYPIGHNLTRADERPLTSQPIISLKRADQREPITNQQPSYNLMRADKRAPLLSYEYNVIPMNENHMQPSYSLTRADQSKRQVGPSLLIPANQKPPQYGPILVAKKVA